MAHRFISTYYQTTNAVIPTGAAAPFTISAWAKTAAANRRIINQVVNQTTAGDCEFHFTATGELAFRIHTTVFNELAGATNVITDTWRHVIGGRDAAGNMYIYVDGVDDRNGATATSTGAISNQPFFVGARITGAVPWAGYLAEMAVWNVWLDDAEIAALANGYRPSRIRPTGLHWYHDLLRDIRPIKGEPFTTITGTIRVTEHPRRIG